MIAEAAAVRFDDEAHRAWIGDRELVRATTALADVGIVDTRWFSEEPLARGQRVHFAACCYFRGQAWPSLGLHREDAPYWDGLVRFADETGFDARGCEVQLCDLVAGYAGQCDLVGSLPQLPVACDDTIDIKTGRAPDWVALQTIGYARRLRTPGRPMRRWALELPGDGRYRLRPLNLTSRQYVDQALDRQHEEVFLGAVRVSRWKRGL